ncbi:DUF4129 domain-containing transglutaminase family protein [Robertmurraya massiliosenegalensis]|uniref:DUF4129 domain-containing transglutaminase family protein n=1 Tax=Robertmurraya massiliosenegalensis TaxID=1287657 RepID=UPI00030F09E0|nr:DUF4129 domain-containing transglutaminase family protein [Robertmurraya massiliosenegalensis]
MSGEKVKGNMLNVCLYICGFFLLWEWLRPLEQLTDTANLGVFIIFLVVSLVLALLKVNVFLRNGIKLLYVLYTINFLYYEGSFFRLKWLLTIADSLIDNMRAVFQGDWTSLTDDFRSILFFILLGLMAYLLRYWLINRKQIFIFFFMTLLYITVLDTFTPYEAKFAIVRTIIVGFALMGILTFYRILDREKLQMPPGFVKKWLAPFVVMLGVSVIIGYIAPKASPIWPDPVPYIKSYSQDSGEGLTGAKKVGYGENDTNLGGPFLPDDTVVYETEADHRQYWKVETKDVYTGKGWISAEENGERIAFDMDEEFPISSYSDEEMKVDERTAIVRPLAQYPHIIYPLGLKHVENDVGHSYEVDVSLEKIYGAELGNLPGIGQYTVEYESPRFSMSRMTSAVDQNHPLLTEEFMEHYTQLPDSLPERVRDLAIELTQDKENWYDKAKTIEQYFGRVDFQYDQRDVAVPGRNEDYVDQFLFETQKGYCDNFSTSMVVMLRSIGIPARWVKGYTEGDFRGMTDSGQRLYVITNNNAHSWVEVFLPEVGWVPFEPTKGFSNNVQISNDLDNEQTNQQDDVLEAPEAPEVEKPEEKEAPLESPTSTFSWSDLGDKIKQFFQTHWEWMIGSMIVLALISYMIYRKRLKWLPYYLLFRFKKRKKDEDFPVAYVTLLKQLERYGLKRKPEQTLREYARYIDYYFSSGEMSALTSTYEQYVYKGKLQDGSWENTKELWENLIKKTIA